MINFEEETWIIIDHEELVGRKQISSHLKLNSTALVISPSLPSTATMSAPVPIYDKSDPKTADA